MTYFKRHADLWTWLLVVGLLCLGGFLSTLRAQQIACPPGGELRITYPAGGALVVCVPPVVTPPPTPPPTPTTPPPVITDRNANPQEVGPGGTTTLRVTTTGGQAPLSYTVTLNGVLVPFTPTSANSGTIVAPTTVGNHVYTVTVTDALNRSNAQQVTVTVKGGGTPPQPPPAGVVISAFNAQPTSLMAGQAAKLTWTVTPANAPMRLTAPGVPGLSQDVTGLTNFNVSPSVTTTFQLQSGVVLRSVTVTVTGVVPPPTEPPPPPPPPPPSPPPGTLPIWGNVDPAILGECSAAAHDRWLINGGDGYRYRLWHPQADPSGCIYAHEHGDDPNRQTNAWVKANWDPRMGYAARRDTTHPGQPNGHEEPHEGYKVFVVNIGDVNDEGRVNQTATTSMPHMGTSGPNRCSVDRHSVSITDWHQNGVHHTRIHTMFRTGTTCNTVCQASRAQAPTKDGLVINGLGQQSCKNNSRYEIWGMALRVLRQNGQTLLEKFATPATFDPITVHNKANPSELVYAWDPRVAAIKNFPGDNWSGNRDCDREGYSQVGYHYNGGDASEEYLLDVRTNTIVTTASNFTTRLVVGRSSTAGNPPFSSDILQFKQRRSHCGLASKLGLKN